MKKLIPIILIILVLFTQCTHKKTNNTRQNEGGQSPEINIPPLKKIPLPDGLGCNVPYEEYEKLDRLPPDEFICLQDSSIPKIIGLKKGDCIADIGCGAGRHSFYYAMMVGEKGKVYAVDVDPNSIAFIDRQRRKMELLKDISFDNIITVQNTFDDACLPPDSIDIAILSHVHNYTIVPEFSNNGDTPDRKESLRKFEKNNLSFTKSIYNALRSGGGGEACYYRLL